MLQLKNITKIYKTNDDQVKALSDVSVNFRKSEFVAILGPSGCGKTTMLNIVGGLDRYTSGDLVINGTSTKEYKDKDWDAYRNHSVGFVFQSYNLIPHISVAENVEMALTLSGVGKAERRQMALDALAKVGLSDQAKKKPAQLSGGQMQRVAIARALVNNPDIILADEPTGALDTKTSVQVMDLLKEVAADRLVVMVTHNPELADTYATRIIRLSDGEIVGDSMPYADEQVERDLTDASEKGRVEELQESKASAPAVKKRKKRVGMSFFTALSLSLRNLFTKKARTVLVSIAGSIGIIGIALILSLSSGFQTYVDNVQRDSLSNYPIKLEQTTTNYSKLMDSMKGDGGEKEQFPDSDKISSSNSLGAMLDAATVGTVTNDLKSFKKYLDDPDTALDAEKVTGVQYSYDVAFNMFQRAKEGVGYDEVNNLNLVQMVMNDTASSSSYASMYSSFLQVFSELIGGQDLIRSQYDLIAGEWNDFDNPGEIVLVVNKYNELSDYALYNLGIEDPNLMYRLYRSLLKTTAPTMTDQQIDAMIAQMGYTYDESKENVVIDAASLVGREYKTIANSDFYKEGATAGVYEYIKMKNPAITGGTVVNPLHKDYLNNLLEESGISLKITGILRLKPSVSSGSISGAIGYSPALTELMVRRVQDSAVVKAQQADESKDVLTGEAFAEGTNVQTNYTAFNLLDLESPSSISIFPTTFENKDYVLEYINQYNAVNKADQSKQIHYTDTIGTLLGSISVIINAISIVLMAFVSISLVVSSIMIGVITYISVLERNKEIGILRAMGASKQDIANIFNAETLIIGFFAGLLGIGITLLLCIPVNIIIATLAQLYNIAALPVAGGIILVLISMILTVISGLIPSSIAAKKDPVVALRSE